MTYNKRSLVLTSTVNRLRLPVKSLWVQLFTFICTFVSDKPKT